MLMSACIKGVELRWAGGSQTHAWREDMKSEDPDALSIAPPPDPSLQTDREAKAVSNHLPTLQQRKYFNCLAFKSI